MSKWLIPGFLGACLLAIPIVSRADTPTPIVIGTPGPTQTSAAEFLFATPTGIPEATPIPNIDFNTQNTARDTAYTAINTYRVFNKDHVIDLAMFGIVGLMAIGFVGHTIITWSNKDK